MRGISGARRHRTSQLNGGSDIPTGTDEPRRDGLCTYGHASPRQAPVSAPIITGVPVLRRFGRLVPLWLSNSGPRVPRDKKDVQEYQATEGYRWYLRPSLVDIWDSRVG